MSIISVDMLSQLNTIDLSPVDSASGPAGAASSFDNYLQQAQTQSAGTGLDSSSYSYPSSSQWNSSVATQATSDAKPQANSPSNQTNSSTTAQSTRQTQDTSTSPAQTTDGPSNRATPAKQQSSTDDASSTSTSGQNDKQPATDHAPAAQDTSQSPGKSKQDDTEKPKQTDAAAVVLDLSTTVVAMANTAQSRGASAADTAKAAGSQQINNASSAATATDSTAAAQLAAAARAAIAAKSKSSGAATANGAKAPAKEKHVDATTGKTLEQAAETKNGTSDVTTAAIVSASATVPAAAAQVTSATAPAGSSAGTAANTADAVASTATTPAVAATVSAASDTVVIPPPTADAASTAPPHVAGQGKPPVPNQSTTAPPADVQVVREQRAQEAVDALTASSDSGDSSSAPEQGGQAHPATPIVTSGPTANNSNAPAGGPNSGNATSGAETNLSQADRVRFVQRVEQAFQDVNGQSGSIRLRLSPPDLGSLHIEIKVAKGEMTARVEADTPAARNLLLDNLPALRDRLAQHDIKVQRFDVDLMDRSGGGAANQSQQQQNFSRQNPGNAVVRTPTNAGSNSPAVVESASPRTASEAGRLNVVV